MLADRISTALVRSEKRNSIDTWLGDFLIPAVNQFGYGSLNGLQTSMPHMRVTEIMATLDSYSAALRRCPPAFAAQMVRALVAAVEHPPEGIERIVEVPQISDPHEHA